MADLGFYADIAGMKSLLEKGENGEEKVMKLIYGLGNVLYEIGEYSSKTNIARFFAYQMGDGFMVHFNNGKYNDENCHGKEDDMVNLAVLMAQRFLLKYGGILHVGLAKGKFFGMSTGGFKFATPALQNNGNGFRCGEGVFFIMPIMGALLAYAYSFANVQSDLPPKKWTQRRVGFSMKPARKLEGVQWEVKTERRSGLTGISRFLR